MVHSLLRTLFAASALLLGLSTSAQAAQDPLPRLHAAVPRSAAEVTAERVAQLEQLAPEIDDWFAELILFHNINGHSAGLRQVDYLLAIKQYVDALLERTLALRGDFAAMEPGEARRERLRNYLRTTSVLIDLSGRLRYMLYDALGGVSNQLLAEPEYFDQFVEVLLQRRSAIGAIVVTAGLSELADAPQRRRSRYSPTATKLKILQLVATTGETEALPAVVAFLQTPGTPAELKIAAAETIRQIGLPQAPRPGRDPTLPTPPITARELHRLVQAVDARQLSGDRQQQRAALLSWLATRAERGVTDERLRVGNFTVEPGDWLLMRNPSPYNLFTDLAPGLFTHVGVVTSEMGSDGIRRMVLVDLPERGSEMNVTNFDTFVLRTLHYVVLRHEDPAVRAKMAEVARSVIGCPTQFDLNFRTERVEKLKGTPLAGQKIHTYCAGLLLLCAQETTAPREEFFPIPEFPAGGKTEENLAQLGLTFGDKFISPTGALFSPRLQIVGRRQSMYDPTREAEEAVFNHFAESLIDRTLTPSPDLFQTIRLKLAEAGKTNPLLARALAEAAGVNQETDLVSAARTAAVVEALDEIAHRASGEFVYARQALLAGSVEKLAKQGVADENLAAVTAYRQRHADLYQRVTSGQITPRDLRVELLEFYIRQGNRELDERFFHTAE